MTAIKVFRWSQRLRDNKPRILLVNSAENPKRALAQPPASTV